jgi:hypothetical protein
MTAVKGPAGEGEGVFSLFVLVSWTPFPGIPIEGCSRQKDIPYGRWSLVMNGFLAFDPIGWSWNSIDDRKGCCTSWSSRKSGQSREEVSNSVCRSLPVHRNIYTESPSSCLHGLCTRSIPVSFPRNFSIRKLIPHSHERNRSLKRSVEAMLMRLRSVCALVRSKGKSAYFSSMLLNCMTPTSF